MNHSISFVTDNSFRLAIGFSSENIQKQAYTNDFLSPLFRSFLGGKWENSRTGIPVAQNVRETGNNGNGNSRIANTIWVRGIFRSFPTQKNAEKATSLSPSAGVVSGETGSEANIGSAKLFLLSLSSDCHSNRLLTATNADILLSGTRVQTLRSP